MYYAQRSAEKGSPQGCTSPESGFDECAAFMGTTGAIRSHKWIDSSNTDR